MRTISGDSQTIDEARGRMNTLTIFVSLYQVRMPRIEVSSEE